MNTFIHVVGEQPVHEGWPRRWKTPVLEAHNHALGVAEKLAGRVAVHPGRSPVFNSTFGQVWAGDSGTP